MAIRQARLELVALSASCHKRMVNGWSAASGKNCLICSQESPGSVNTKIEGPLVEIGSRSVFGNTAVGGRVASGGGFAPGLTPLVWWKAAGSGVGRGASEEWSVACEAEGSEPAVIEKRQNEARAKKARERRTSTMLRNLS